MAANYIKLSLYALMFIGAGNRIAVSSNRSTVKPRSDQSKLHMVEKENVFGRIHPSNFCSNNISIQFFMCRLNSYKANYRNITA
jgi:hypothetical protein